MPDALYERAKAKATRQGETVSSVVRAFLERYVAEDDEPGEQVPGSGVES